jgi:hypothetical protein
MEVFLRALSQLIISFIELYYLEELSTVQFDKGLTNCSHILVRVFLKTLEALYCYLLLSPYLNIPLDQCPFLYKYRVRHANFLF